MSQYWGYHLILDCKSCDIDSITDRYNIHSFIKELVKTIDMIAYGEPIIEHFAEFDPDKAGYSLVQLIETSSITAHFVDKNGDAYIDIFSCKPYSEDDAIKCVKKYFEPEQVRKTILTRQA